MDERTMIEVLERLKGRFYGKYRGTVTDVERGGRGRIKAKVPAVLGEQKTGWCEPCVPYAGPDAGFVFLPAVSSGVWIEFEGGDVSYPIWVGCYFRDGELPGDAAPDRRLLRSSAGQLLFDDERKSIALTDPNGNAVALDRAGISLTRGARKVEVTPSIVSVNDGALEVR